MQAKVIPIFSGNSGVRQGCGADGEVDQPSCGSRAGPGDLSPAVWEKVKNHPCYSEEAHHHYARMHVAVAPACNIQCNYCNRKYDCSNESRPGVVSEKLTPEMAAKKVLAVASVIPQMTVVGIAGPGDPLANPAKTFQTFDLIMKAAPDIKLCLSTNGLALPDYVQAIQDFNVDHVTMTINTIDPEIGQQIYPWIFYRKKRWKGKDAAKILIERQLEGLEMLTAKGILVKVNSVMIPGVNDTHLETVNQAVKSRGAFLHNIMPLISEPEHGTYYGLNGQRGPTTQELKILQDRCEGDMTVMRHCRQCRADAVGLLGEDRSAEFTTEKIQAMDVQYDRETRQAYQEYVEQERQDKVAAKEAALAALAGETDETTVLVAVATKGGSRINEHFGHAAEFQVYELSVMGAKFVGHRRVDHYCLGGYGEEETLETVIKAIDDCTAVFIAKIGLCPRKALETAGIDVADQYAHAYIEQSLIAWFKDYLERAQRGDIQSGGRGNGQLRQGAYVA